MKANVKLSIIVACLLGVATATVVSGQGVGVLERWLELDPAPKLAANLDANSQDVVSVANLGIGTASPSDKLHTVFTNGFFLVEAGTYAPNVIAGADTNAINDSASSCVIAGGGYHNGATNMPNVINGADSRYSTIGGGYDNTAEGIVSSIIGAHHTIGPNVADPATHTTILGGSYGTITGGDYNSIMGGTVNSIDNSSNNSSIFGASNSDIGETSAATYGVIVGGNNHTMAGGSYSVIVGGLQSSTATASYSSTIGGIYLSATGNYSTALGGHTSVASGLGSLAWGRQAKATADGTVSYADWHGVDFTNATANSMAMRFSGGWKFAYDATNYVTMAVQSDGDVVFDSNKSSYDIDFGDGVVTTTGSVNAEHLHTSDDLVVDGQTSNAIQSTTLAAAATTLAATKNVITLTGDAGANTLATISGGLTGQTLTILFVDANITITDTDAHTADTVDLSAAFTSADDTVLVLLYDGTSWYEVSRSAN